MSIRRIIAFGLVATAAAAFANASRDYVYPAVICAIALAGVPGRYQVRITPGRRTILMLALTLIFALKWRFAPADDSDVQGFAEFPLAHATAQYLLLLMAVHFFLRVGDGLPVALLLVGLVVLLSAGDVIVEQDEDRVYQAFATVYAVLAALYCAACRKPTSRPATRPASRYIAAGIVMTAVLAGAAAGSHLLRAHEQEIKFLLAEGRFFYRPRGRSQTLGLSDRSSLTSVTRIRKSDTNAVAVRVFSDRVPPYLRAHAFERYANSAWHSPSGGRKLLPADDGAPVAVLPGATGNVFLVRKAPGQALRALDIWPDPDMTSGTLTPLHTAVFQAAVDVISVDDNDVVEADELAGGVNYAAGALADPPAQSLSRHRRQRYLLLPKNLDARVRELAGSIFAGHESTIAKISAVENHFRQNYEYRLGITIPSGRDPLTFFLTERPAAHCEYFATGAAVLLRLANVPTRYVTGFVASERASFGDYWVARNRDAHAWVEAWDGDRECWVTVEATPASGVPAGQSAGRLGQLWDHALFRLQELRVALHLHGVKGLARWLAERLRGLAELLVTTVPGLIVTALLAVLVGRRIWRKLRSRSRTKPPAPEIAALHRLLARMDKRLAGLGLARGPAETLHQFATRIGGEAPSGVPLDRAAAWYVQYARTRYGGHVDAEAIERLEAAIPAGRG